jgi:hypothetical protein
MARPLSTRSTASPEKNNEALTRFASQKCIVGPELDDLQASDCQKAYGRAHHSSLAPENTACYNSLFWRGRRDLAAAAVRVLF